MEFNATRFPLKTRRTVLGAALVLGLGAGCSRTADAPKAPAPAAVANPTTEGNLQTVTLTPEAEARLGVHVVTVAMESIAKARTVGGEVIVPPGRSVTVSAPIPATVQSAGTTVLRPGSRVERGQALLTLFPLQPAERDVRIEADRELAAADAELQAAEQRLGRLESLLKDGATSVRAVEEARALQQVAAARAKAARARVESVRGGPIGTRGEVVVAAPLSGVVQDVSVAPGQTVAAGAPLFTITQIEALWIKVPIYVGDRDLIDPSQPIAVSSLSARSGTTIVASRVNGPPSADPTTSTFDLFFAPATGSETLRAGERVSVQLPLRESVSALVVPAAAVVYDMQGGTWVYEALANHVFARRRIEVKGQSGDKILVDRGLQAGQKIVTAGAAELFGTEFGAGK